MQWKCRGAAVETRSPPRLLFHITSLPHRRRYIKAAILHCCSLLIGGRQMHRSAARFYLTREMISKFNSLLRQEKNNVMLVSQTDRGCDRGTHRWRNKRLLSFSSFSWAVELSGSNAFWLLQPSTAKTTYRVTSGEKQGHEPVAATLGRMKEDNKQNKQSGLVQWDVQHEQNWTSAPVPDWINQPSYCPFKILKSVLVTNHGQEETFVNLWQILAETCQISLPFQELWSLNFTLGNPGIRFANNVVL